MQLKDYQEKAVNELMEDALELLKESDDKTLVFKAPTGSGKTIMTAEFLARLADRTDKPQLSFIWVAPRNLHGQSYDKLDKYYEDTRALECRYFNDLSDREIGENEILFFNWESIRQKDKNIYVRENEQDMYLGKILENTKEAGREVVLLIDESHFHAPAGTSQQLIADIAPKLTVQISATPKITLLEKLVSVSLKQAKQEGMIKAFVLLNGAAGNSTKPSGGGVVTFTESTDKLLLERALKKRRKLAAAYQKAGVNINPLLCIQLPDRRTEQDDIIRETAEKVLYEKGITTENGKLAIWLSNEHENCENLSLNDSEAEVLIFKQAISLGWDCPRAQILVLFRNWNSMVFSVQTLGRIMRMPEQIYYNDDILNKAYVYTNMSDAEIHEDVAGGYVHIYTANRIEEYEELKLKSVNRIRQREQTRLSPRFSELFLEQAEKYKLKGRIEPENQTVQRRFIENYVISHIDEITGKTITGTMRADLENEEDLQKLFDSFVRGNLTPYYPEQRSINRVKMAIYDFFRQSLNMDFADKQAEIISITLSEENCPHFIRVLERAKEKYQQETAKRKAELQTTESWEIQEKATYGDSHTEKRKIKKSVIMPFYAANNMSKLEQEFIGHLENAAKVKWWCKNGEKDSLYFAVPYTENEEENPFYVDFIVCFTDGTIGLYDTKGGITLAIAGDKSDGLLKHIREENKKRKSKKPPPLTGGIITQPKTGGWKVYMGKGKNITKNTPADWETLKLN